MKKHFPILLSLILLSSFSNKLFAQSLDRQVMNAMGGVFSAIGSAQLTINMGETFVGTYTHNNSMLTEGFIQPQNILYIPAISGNLSICLGSNTQLQDSIAGGVWSSANPQVTIIDPASGVVQAIGIGTTLITYTLQEKSVNATITVHGLPFANAGSNKSICTNGSTYLNASGGDSYLWSHGDTSTNTLVSQAGAYYVIAYNSFGCADTSTTVSVAIKTMPTTVKIKVVGLTSVCEPATIPLQLDMPLGSTTGFDYQWKLGGTPIAGATDSIYNASASGMYSLTISGGNACFKNATGKTVSIKPLPNASFTAGGPTTFCLGQSVAFTAPTIIGYTYSWLNNGMSAGSGVTKIFKVAGNITLIAKLAGCADTTITPVPIVVNPLPIASVAADPNTPTTFCAGQSCNLWAAPMGATNYHWVSGTNIIDLPTYINNISTAGSWKVSITDNNGCISKASSSITTKVNAIPTASITSTGNVSVIAFSPSAYIKLNATPASGVTWQWYLNGNAIAGATIKSYNAMLAGSYTVTCTKLGCTGVSAPLALTKASSKDEVATNVIDEQFEINAYPNPVNDVLTVNVSGIEKASTAYISILNSVGQLIATKTFSIPDNCQLPTDNWASGIYFVRYKDSEGRTGTIKITKL